LKNLVHTALPKIFPAGTVRILVNNEVTLANGKSLVLYDTLSIFEHIAEKFPDKGVWPQNITLRAMARSLFSEMHSDFNALRSFYMMNIGPAITDAEAIIWLAHYNVRQGCSSAIERMERCFDAIRRVISGRFGFWRLSPLLRANCYASSLL
jgi:glutathione S-transferase